ncbi:transport and Golgi organization protein 6 homolog [Ptychodera flava]|uniref:transport and Golgi organization protein 6 homolog n=1 Tax=Ptychodera flava TaxID=63121 RepID=UPI00396A1EE3
MDESNVMRAMAILISPEAKPTASTTSQTQLQQQLATKMTEFDEKLETDFAELLHEFETEYDWQKIKDCEDIAWKYTQYSVCVLKRFVGETSKDDILSVRIQKMVESLLQFIVYLGICPNLIPGVGIPLNRRSKFAALIENRTRYAYDCDSQLIYCLKALLSCTKVTSLSVVVLTKHLNDLLASFLQICHAPRKKSSSSTEQESTSMQSGSEVKMFTEEDKLYCQQELGKLLSKIYQPLLVQELLLLQSGGSPRSPRWMKVVCGNILSDILLKPKGVLAIVKGTLQTSADSPSAKDWQKCDGLGRLIANCPKKISVVEDYYKLICKQVLDLFHSCDGSLKSFTYHVAASCITAMYSQHPDLAKQYLIEPLQHPLSKCLVSDAVLDSNVAVLVDERELSQCLQDLRHLYTYNGDPNSALRVTLQPILCPLFHLYCHTNKGISPLRSILKDILSVFFKSQKPLDSVELLYGLALPTKTETVLPKLREDIQFINDADGGVAIVTADFKKDSAGNDNDDDDDDDDDGTGVANKMDCVVEVIQVINNETLTADFFIKILRELTKILAEDFWTPQTPTNTSESKTLLEIEDNLSQLSESYNHAMNVLSLISSMCDVLGTSMLNQTLHILEFAETTLLRMCEICEQSGDQLDPLIADTLTMTLGLVAMLYQPSDKMESDVKIAFQKMTSVLKKLSEVCPNTFLGQMAADLHITLATHNAVSPNLESLRDETLRKSTKGVSNSSKVDETMKKSDRDEKEVNGSSERGVTSTLSDLKMDNTGDETVEFDEIYKELSDPSIPIRAHAIRALTKLLAMRDSKALDEKDKLLKVFQENLESDDAYLYLSAIQGVVALVDISAQTVLPILCKQFTSTVAHPENIEMRMKIGEALVRSSRVLGAMLPAYVKPLIGALLIGVKDTDPSIRASSLSNLAEVCFVIKAAITPVIHEIVSCIHDIVKTESENEVRRAAVHVIRQLLSALQEDSLQVLENCDEGTVQYIEVCSTA